MSDNFQWGKKIDISRINRLLNHPMCYRALFHVIRYCEEAYKNEITRSDKILSNEKIIPITSIRHDERLKSEKVQNFYKHLSENPWLEDHFCDLFHYKYLPSCNKLLCES